MLETERLGQKASKNDWFSANCANTSKALVQHLSPERKINQVHPGVSSSFPLISERCQVSCSPTHGPEISIFQSSQAEEEHIEKKIITIEDEVKAKLAPSGFKP